MKKVLYHDSCADGFCAAWICSNKFKDEAEYIPVQYGQAPPELNAEDEVFIVDFSYKRPVIEEIASKVKSLVVLDHHESAQKELDNLELPNAIIQFDMNRSGAGMTYDYMYPNQERHWLVDYVEDRDLWRFKLPNSKLVNDAISLYKFDFSLWDLLAMRNKEELVHEGKILAIYKDQVITTAIKKATEVNISGYVVPCLNCTTLISEIVGEMAKGKLFAASYFFREDGKCQWSLRSNKEGGLNVAEIAKQFGGGGHKNAAGFETETREHPLISFPLDKSKKP